MNKVLNTPHTSAFTLAKALLRNEWSRDCQDVYDHIINELYKEHSSGYFRLPCFSVNLTPLNVSNSVVRRVAKKLTDEGFRVSPSYHDDGIPMDTLVLGGFGDD